MIPGAGAGRVPGIAHTAVDAGTRIAYKAGMNLATYLERSKMTKAELARELDTSRGHIGDILSGRRKLGKKTAQKLEKLTGKPWWKWVSA